MNSLKYTNTLSLTICIFGFNGCAIGHDAQLPPNRLQVESDYLELDETSIKCASVADSRSHSVSVAIDLRPAAAKWFQDMTASKVGESFDIVISSNVIFAPRVLEPILGNSISISGRSQTDTADLLEWLSTLVDVPACSSDPEPGD